MKRKMVFLIPFQSFSSVFSSFSSLFSIFALSFFLSALNFFPPALHFLPHQFYPAFFSPPCRGGENATIYTPACIQSLLLLSVVAPADATCRRRFPGGAGQRGSTAAPFCTARCSSVRWRRIWRGSGKCPFRAASTTSVRRGLDGVGRRRRRRRLSRRRRRCGAERWRRRSS